MDGTNLTNVQAWCHEGKADREPLHYTECGLDDVYLVSGYDVQQTQYGDGLTIKDLDELHEAIGRYLACHKKDLSGKEIKYLRKEMDLTQSELARLIGMNSQQIARWEKEESQIPGPADLLIRALYIGYLDKAVDVRALAQGIEELDSNAANEAYFVNTGHGWKQAVNQ